MTAPQPHHAGRVVAISAGSLAVLLGALDTYVVVTIMRDIIGTIGIPVNHLQRITPIITWYLLGYIAAMPLLGRASDRFGRKLLLQVSLATFLIGSVITALSTDLDVLVVGRTVQGVASGALLPVTLALGADLWSQRNRAGVLGGIGAAQELGSVLGPLYGIFIVWLTSRWQDVFWINVPLALAAMVMIHFSLPSRDRSAAPEKIDIVGGLLLAITLGLAVIGLYNANPDGKHALPSYGPPLIVAAVIFAVIFFVWERFSRTKLIEPAGRALPAVPVRARLVAVCRCRVDGDAGRCGAVRPGRARQGPGPGRDDAAVVPGRAADRRARGWRDRDQDRRPRGGLRRALIAAGGYWLISKWSINLLAQHHNIFGLSLPAIAHRPGRRRHRAWVW